MEDLGPALLTLALSVPWLHHLQPVISHFSSFLGPQGNPEFPQESRWPH